MIDLTNSIGLRGFSECATIARGGVFLCIKKLESAPIPGLEHFKKWYGRKEAQKQLEHFQKRYSREKAQKTQKGPAPGMPGLQPSVHQEARKRLYSGASTTK
jgi:hypothetical protein